MRRLLPILLNVATVLSLLLCVTTAGLWILGSFGSDRSDTAVPMKSFHWRAGTTRWCEVATGRGSFYFLRVTAPGGFIDAPNKYEQKAELFQDTDIALGLRVEGSDVITIHPEGTISST